MNNFSHKNSWHTGAFKIHADQHGILLIKNKLDLKT